MVGTIRAAARTASGEQYGAATSTAALPPGEAAAALDAERAAAAAGGLGESWRGSYDVARAAGATAEVAHEGAAVDLATTYANRTAATEAAHAYNTETMRLAALAADAGAPVVITWSSVLDQRTCERCADMDGNVLAPDDEPPPLHPNCLCTLVPST